MLTGISRASPSVVAANMIGVISIVPSRNVVDRPVTASTTSAIVVITRLSTK